MYRGSSKLPPSLSARDVIGSYSGLRSFGQFCTSSLSVQIVISRPQAAAAHTSRWQLGQGLSSLPASDFQLMLRVSLPGGGLSPLRPAKMSSTILDSVWTVSGLLVFVVLLGLYRHPRFFALSQSIFVGSARFFFTPVLVSPPVRRVYGCPVHFPGRFLYVVLRCPLVPHTGCGQHHFGV